MRVTPFKKKSPLKTGCEGNTFQKEIPMEDMPLCKAQGLYSLYKENKMNTKKDYQLNYLSPEFYCEYNSNDYPEIENKENRPYMVVLIKIENNTFAVPFRTNVPHNNCYKFKKSTRPTNTVTGLDYTKAVIVNDSKYIGAAARINDKEYIEFNTNYSFIVKQFKKFVFDYIKFANGKTNYYSAKKFKYTTLKYFHEQLGIYK